MRNNGEVRAALTKLSESVDSLVPKGGKAGPIAKTNGDLGDLVEQEMLGAAQAIEAAVRKALDDKPAGGFELRTADLGGSVKTSELGDKIVEILKGLL